MAAVIKQYFIPFTFFMMFSFLSPLTIIVIQLLPCRHNQGPHLLSPELREGVNPSPTSKLDIQHSLFDIRLCIEAPLIIFWGLLSFLPTSIRIQNIPKFIAALKSLFPFFPCLKHDPYQTFGTVLLKAVDPDDVTGDRVHTLPPRKDPTGHLLLTMRTPGKPDG
jgi:hypothetical protein